jgi:hypothetical protein
MIIRVNCRRELSAGDFSNMAFVNPIILIIRGAMTRAAPDVSG